MPHCIVEFSSEIQKSVTPEQIINAVYHGALNSELFEDYDIKTRAIAFDSYQTGPLKEAFVHVTIKILTGRNIVQKRTLSESIMSQLRSIDFPSTILTVEVVEIEKESYSKAVIIN